MASCSVINAVNEIPPVRKMSENGQQPTRYVFAMMTEIIRFDAEFVLSVSYVLPCNHPTAKKAVKKIP